MVSEIKRRSFGSGYVPFDVFGFKYPIDDDKCCKLTNNKYKTSAEMYSKLGKGYGIKLLMESMDDTLIDIIQHFNCIIVSLRPSILNNIDTTIYVNNKRYALANLQWTSESYLYIKYPEDSSYYKTEVVIQKGYSEVERYHLLFEERIPIDIFFYIAENEINFSPQLFGKEYMNLPERFFKMYNRMIPTKDVLNALELTSIDQIKKSDLELLRKAEISLCFKSELSNNSKYIILSVPMSNFNFAHLGIEDKLKINIDSIPCKYYIDDITDEKEVKDVIQQILNDNTDVSYEELCTVVGNLISMKREFTRLVRDNEYAVSNDVNNLDHEAVINALKSKLPSSIESDKIDTDTLINFINNAL